MPYTRKTTYKKRTPYKKPVRYQVADMALQAYNGVKAIKRLINVEVKYHDVLTNVTVSSTGSITDLSAIPQGDTVLARDGDSAKPQYFATRFYMFNDGSYGDSTIVRVIYFRAIMENGTTPAVTDILESANVVALKNYTEKNRFTIISDRTFTWTPSKTGEVRSIESRFGHRLEKHFKFVTGANTKENGGLYMLLVSNRGTLLPTMYHNSRVTYTDN